jgi:hypothetical protein
MRGIQLRSNVVSRFLDKTRNEQPGTHQNSSSFLSAGKQCNNFASHWLTRSDSAYRQKIQRINDEKYTIQNEIIPQAEVSKLDLHPIVSNHDTS